MSKIAINNGDSGLTVRNALNGNFTEIYNSGAGDAVMSRIKRAVAGLPTTRRNRSTPIIAAPAWVLSTAVFLGQRVTNGGNVYVCGVAGTTAASGGPTTTGFALITDNTASWYYVGAATTTASDAPTMTAGTTAPTTGRAWMNSASAVTQTGLTVVKNDSWYNGWGTTSGTMTSGILGATNDGNASSGISFMLDGDNFTVRADVNSGAYLQIEVDGQYLTDGAYFYSTTGSAVYLKVQFPTRKTGRRIALRWNGSLSTYTVKAIITDVYGMVYAPVSRAGNVKGFYMGDSFSINTNAGDNVEHGIASNLFAELGIESFYINGVGGTGFSAGGANYYQSASRIAKITSYQPDLVVIMSSLNDNGVAAGTMQAAVSSVISQVRAAVPNAWIIVTGQLSCITSGGETTIDATTRAQLVSIADPKLIFIPGSGDVAGPYIVGSGTVAAPSAGGNCDVYLGSDATHPVARGYEYIGKRLGETVRRTLLALA